MQDEMNDKRAFEIIMRRIGKLAERVNENPQFTYDKNELNALLYLLKEYKKIKNEESFGNK
jgi:hypothetical protein